jgi:hypothetical protein
MASWRNKLASQPHDFQKRRTFAQGKPLLDAAHLATYRLYCDAFAFWRSCADKACLRHRRCTGDARRCLGARFWTVSQARRLRAQAVVIAGGGQRLPPASHVEWTVRREEFARLLSWPFD